ncbi:MAG TPA: c-type cytochrome [Bryobacteraceae bacterium]|nr:c-type cytochrome [Bryobacteraceae bacterium]
MNVRMKWLIPVSAGAAVLWMASVAKPQSAPKPKMDDEVFKNIQVLKGIPVDDFLGTMGIMSAAVGFDCSECHTNAGTDKVDWAADDNPKKVTARRMVTMVQAINRDNFSNRQNVTCWTCHHGRDRPSTSPTLEFVYGPGPSDMDDVLAQAPGQPSPTEILDKYIQALGGAAKLATLKSYVATGTSVGFGGFGGGGEVHIYAKSPDMRSTIIEFKKETERPDSIRTCNGKTAWIKTPLTVLGEYQLTGTEYEGAKLDAEMSFPGQIKQILTSPRVSLPTSIGDLPGPSAQTSTEKNVGIGQDVAVNVLQGTGPGGTLTTLYFDQKTGLLLRMKRYGRTPIGRVPTQMDFSDYRDVGGIKFPFSLTFAWLDGRDAIQLSDIKLNVAIPDSKFNTPESAKQ